MRHNLADMAKLHEIGVKNRSALESTQGIPQLPKDLLKDLAIYCAADTDMLRDLFYKLYPHVVDDEMELIDMTVRMFCEPALLLDEARAQAALDEERRTKNSAVNLSGLSPQDLAKNAVFADALTKLGVTPPTKTSPTTGREVFAFAKSDMEFTALLNHEDEQVRNLCIARQRVKSTIGETRAERMLQVASQNHATVPVALNYWGAHTGRWSGGNKMNLQNLKRGGELRKSLVAPPGYVVMVADSAQIEARVLAWLAGQDDIVDAFARGEDVYKKMASRIYGVLVEEVTKDQRFVGKIAVLGLGYGMGAAKFHDTLRKGVMGPPVDLGENEAQRVVHVYRTANHKIGELWKLFDNVLRQMALGKIGRASCRERVLLLV
jgi:DNA polymerase